MSTSSNNENFWNAIDVMLNPYGKNVNFAQGYLQSFFNISSNFSQIIQNYVEASSIKQKELIASMIDISIKSNFIAIGQQLLLQMLELAISDLVNFIKIP